MEVLSVTTNATSLRYVNVNGREFAVANIKIIVPGVLAGSKGPLYYPQDEIARDVHINSWNGKPLVVYHPVANDGTNISANNPETFIKQEIGRVYNAKIDHSDNGLEVEGWFDVEMTKKIDSRVWNALSSKNKIEVSTGLFTENVDAPSNSAYKGKPYNYIARNYRPDHLAILPDEKGACSIKDGCGVFNRVDYPEKCPHCETVLEIDPDSGICNRCSKQVSKVDNKGDNNKSQLDDKTVTADADKDKLTNPTGNNMKDRNKAIESLVANCDCFKANGAKDNLLKMSDADFNNALIANAGKIIEEETKNEDTKFLNWMATASEDVQKAFVASMKKTMMGRNAAPPVDDPTKKPAPTPDPNNPNPPALSPEEEAKKKALAQQQALAGNQMTKDAILNMFPDLKALVDNAATIQKIADSEKDKLIAQLTAHITDNSQKSKATQMLSTKTLADLQERVLLAPPAPVQNTNQGYNFFGAIGGPVGNTGGYDVRNDILDVPVMNYSEEAKLNGKKS